MAIAECLIRVAADPEDEVELIADFNEALSHGLSCGDTESMYAFLGGNRP